MDKKRIYKRIISKTKGMNFRSIVETLEYPFHISHKDKNLFLGSCFSENIGRKLKDLKFQTLINPSGILYNPLSIESSINLALSNKTIQESDLFLQNGVWNNYKFHSSLSFSSKEQSASKMNSSLENLKFAITEYDYIFITFGTAYIYRLKETKEIVCNCHKTASQNFIHERLKVDQISIAWEQLINKIINLNPKTKIIFTISPIRHWKDGAINNQISKSTLFLAVNELIQRFSDNCFYFPSYEIMIDDLRDYRFYTEDMMHPTNMAISYILSKFSQSFFIDHTIGLNKKVEKINNSLLHRPFNPDSQDHKVFRDNLRQQILNLMKEETEIDFLEDLDNF